MWQAAGTRAGFCAPFRLHLCELCRPFRAVFRYDLEVRARYWLHTKGVLVWTVFAPAMNLAPGALSGNYVGGSASVTLGIGIGANALVGGSFNSIVLQPLSIETNQGLNVSAGVTSINLLSPG